MKFRLLGRQALSIAFWGSLVLPAPVGAVEDRCVPLALEAALVGYVSWHTDKGTETFVPSAYADANSLLFLSEGSSLEGKFTLGDKVAAAFPDKRVVSGDIVYRGSTTEKNHTFQHIDNSKPLDFPDDSFDHVVMRRGLCLCQVSITRACCSGIAPISREAQRFFREVTRVLNKKNPKALAVLQGTQGIEKAVTLQWKAYLEELEREFGVRITMDFRPDDKFFMITIRPK